MAYTEGTATDQFDLLGKIKLFLEDNGWTTASYTTDSTNSEQSSSAKRLHIYKNGRYLNFRSTLGGYIINMYNIQRWGIGFNIGTGYNSSSPWGYQPGVTSFGNPMQNILYVNSSVSYKMFLWDSPFTFFVHIQNSSIVFGQMYFGEISPKYGSWDGGTIFLSNLSAVTATGESYASAGSRDGVFIDSASFTSPTTDLFKGAINITTSGVIPNSYTWATYGTFQSDSLSIYSLLVPSLLSSPTLGENDNNLANRLLLSMPPSFNTPIILLPIQPALVRDQTNYRYSLLGELPYMKITRGSSSLSGSVVTYGGTKYILLPIGYSSTDAYQLFVAVEYEGS